jgi:hypothetical protein
MVRVIIQTSENANMVASSASASGIKVTGVNPTLGFVYAEADANQVNSISSHPGVKKVFYDEPVKLM